MDFLIDKKSNIQINEQVRVQLRYQIINGELKSGTQLPSVREMASVLNVNRHTISKAYKELENEGLIVTKQSLGTFIAENIDVPKKNDFNKFIKIIKEAMEMSDSIGFTKKEFIDMARSIYLKEKNCRKIKGLFVECNESALKQYVNDIREKLEIDIEGCLLEDIEERKVSLSQFEEYDLIMTTAAHYPYLKRILNNNNNIYAINFGPFLQVLSKVKDLPKETKIGVVCINETGAMTLKQVLIDSGAIQGFICTGSVKDLKKVEELVSNVDVLVASKYALEENAEFFSNLSIKIIEYSNVIQETSVRMLDEVISQMRQS